MGMASGFELLSDGLASHLGLTIPFALVAFAAALLWVNTKFLDNALRVTSQIDAVVTKSIALLLCLTQCVLLIFVAAHHEHELQGKAFTALVVCHELQEAVSTVYGVQELTKEHGIKAKAGCTSGVGRSFWIFIAVLMVMCMSSSILSSYDLPIKTGDHELNELNEEKRTHLEQVFAYAVAFLTMCSANFHGNLQSLWAAVQKRVGTENAERSGLEWVKYTLATQGWWATFLGVRVVAVAMMIAALRDASEDTLELFDAILVVVVFLFSFAHEVRKEILEEQGIYDHAFWAHTEEASSEEPAAEATEVPTMEAISAEATKGGNKKFALEV